MLISNFTATVAVFNATVAVNIDIVLNASSNTHQYVCFQKNEPVKQSHIRIILIQPGLRNRKQEAGPWEHGNKGDFTSWCWILHRSGMDRRPVEKDWYHLTRHSGGNTSRSSGYILMAVQKVMLKRYCGSSMIMPHVLS